MGLPDDVLIFGHTKQSPTVIAANMVTKNILTYIKFWPPKAMKLSGHSDIRAYCANHLVRHRRPFLRSRNESSLRRRLRRNFGTCNPSRVRGGSYYVKIQDPLRFSGAEWMTPERTRSGGES